MFSPAGAAAGRRLQPALVLLPEPLRPRGGVHGGGRLHGRAVGLLGHRLSGGGLISLLLLNLLITGRILMFPMLLWGITGAVVVVGIGLVVAISPGGFSTALPLAAALGIFVNALPPIVLSLVVEATFPMAESLGIGVTKSLCYLTTVAGLETLHYLVEWQPTYVGIFSGANCFMMALYLVGAGLLWSCKPRLRRYEAELQRAGGGGREG
ncbi:unnamed protein product [Heterosigma akashiwo]